MEEVESNARELDILRDDAEEGTVRIRERNPPALDEDTAEDNLLEANENAPPLNIPHTPITTSLATYLNFRP